MKIDLKSKVEFSLHRPFKLLWWHMRVLLSKLWDDVFLHFVWKKALMFSDWQKVFETQTNNEFVKDGEKVISCPSRASIAFFVQRPSQYSPLSSCSASTAFLFAYTNNHLRSLLNVSLCIHNRQFAKQEEKLSLHL